MSKQEEKEKASDKGKEELVQTTAATPAKEAPLTPTVPEAPTPVDL